MAEKWLGWHFLNDDGRTGYGKRKPVPGRLMHCRGKLILCWNGLHASKRAIDALRYARGPIIQRVELVGERIDDDDKSCALSRRCLWIGDATRALHEFALWCAKGSLNNELVAGREPDAPSWEALAVKRRWLDGLATDDELAAARAASCEAALEAAPEAARAAARAAREAARAASSAASWDATWAAASAASWDAARYAAGDAAWAAVRAEQNTELERRLMALAPEGYTEEAE